MERHVTVILAFTPLVRAFYIARNALLTVVTWVQEQALILSDAPALAHPDAVELSRAPPGPREDSTIVTCLDSPPPLLR